MATTPSPADFAPIEQGSFWLPKAGSTIAHTIDTGWGVAMWISVIFFILVTVPVVFFAWKYKRHAKSELPPPTGHNTPLEIAWSVIPLAILMGCFLVGFRGFLDASVAPSDAYEIKVTGQKWLWTFYYPNDYVSPGEIRVPAGRPIKLTMSSKDVIHSFWVPEFRTKQDVVPGMYTGEWFTPLPELVDSTAEAEGKLQKDEHGFMVRNLTVECTEYCGKDHSMMLAHMVVMKEDDFNKWLDVVNAPPPGEPPEKTGEKLFAKNNCNTCHSLTETPLPGGGPAFKGLYGRQEKLTSGETVSVDDAYIHESILEPTKKVVSGFAPIMPPFQGQLNDKQISYLIAYLKTLK
jgi:cytochrome c oxidase subunit 2